MLFNRAIQLWVCNSVITTSAAIVFQAVLNISVAQNPALPQNLPVLFPPPPAPPPIVKDRSPIVSFERTWRGASLRYHQRLLESNKPPLFLRIWSPLKFKNSPKERAFGRVQTIALLLYGPEQRGIPMDFMSNMKRQDSLLQKSLCLWDHNQQHHRASAWQFYPWTEWPVYFEADSATSYSSFSSCLVFRFSPIVLTLLTSRIILWNNYQLRFCEQLKIILWMEIRPGLVNDRCSTVMSYQVNLSN